MTNAVAEPKEKKKGAGASKQPDLPGTPAPKGAAKKALEFMRQQKVVQGEEETLTSIGDKVLAAMKEEGRGTMKVKDPDTGKTREFFIREGQEKLSVRSVKEKFAGGDA